MCAGAERLRHAQSRGLLLRKGCHDARGAQPPVELGIRHRADEVHARGHLEVGRVGEQALASRTVANDREAKRRIQRGHRRNRHVHPLVALDGPDREHDHPGVGERSRRSDRGHIHPVRHDPDLARGPREHPREYLALGRGSAEDLRAVVDQGAEHRHIGPEEQPLDRGVQGEHQSPGVGTRGREGERGVSAVRVYDIERCGGAAQVVPKCGRDGNPRADQRRGEPPNHEAFEFGHRRQAASQILREHLHLRTAEGEAGRELVDMALERARTRKVAGGNERELH